MSVWVVVGIVDYYLRSNPHYLELSEPLARLTWKNDPSVGKISARESLAEDRSDKHLHSCTCALVPGLPPAFHPQNGHIWQLVLRCQSCEQSEMVRQRWRAGGSTRSLSRDCSKSLWSFVVCSQLLFTQWVDAIPNCDGEAETVDSVLDKHVSQYFSMSKIIHSHHDPLVWSTPPEGGILSMWRRKDSNRSLST